MTKSYLYYCLNKTNKLNGNIVKYTLRIEVSERVKHYQLRGHGKPYLDNVKIIFCTGSFSQKLLVVTSSNLIE